MNIELDEKPLKPIIIEGFPGFGFIGTIATEFLINHLEAKPIGRITSDKIHPIAAIRKTKVIYPLEIFYDKKTNIIIIQTVTPIEGLEWEVAETVIKLAEELNAKEVISIEGISTNLEVQDPQVFFHSNKLDKIKSIEKMSLKQMEDGVIIGVTGALLIKLKKTPFSCFFVETHSNLPDNKGAAKIIEALDRYLGLTIDYKPLLKKAEEVEGKLKEFLSKLSEVKTEKEKKKLSYMG